jgi:hypothetical protein
MNEQQEFITKLAQSSNPLLQQLGLELGQMQPQQGQPQPNNTAQPNAVPQHEDASKAVESDAVTGSETNSKPPDEIDQLLGKQMPEMDVDTDNQSRFSKQKVSTVRDVLRERLGYV